jgi:hypothetical protein
MEDHHFHPEQGQKGRSKGGGPTDQLPFPTWAGSPLLRQPGGPPLPGGHHIDAELSADTRSA